MKITGFQLKHLLKKQELRKEALAQELEGTYAKLPNDTGTRTPKSVLDELAAVEKQIALLQTAQAQYNQKNIVVLPSGLNGVPLAYVIKYEGVQNRICKMWKDTAKQAVKSHDLRFGLEKDHTYPVSQVDLKECLVHAMEASDVASRLQGAIGVANSRELEVDDVLLGEVLA